MRCSTSGICSGSKQGDNPHQWYSPASVQRVIDQIVADYKRLDPKDAAYFDQQRTLFETQGLSQYDRLIAQIRARYAGVPVGYSESIFQPLGQALGLKLMTPYSFAKAIAEGTDVSAADKQTVDTQAQSRQIKVWVYNSQNATPDVQRVNQLARAAHIPITTVTETLSPASATFEQWQVAELRSLQRRFTRRRADERLSDRCRRARRGSALTERRMRRTSSRHRLCGWRGRRPGSAAVRCGAM